MMQENYLAKWLNNELTEEELSEFKKTEGYASYVKIKEASNRMKAPDFKVDDAWQEFQNTQRATTQKVIPLNPYKQFLKIAAVIAVMLVGSYFYLNSLDVTYATQLAEQTNISLPDASEVVLNADSKLGFGKKDWKKQRKLTLEGEAFFKVAKGKKFTVQTTLGEVTVLGTEFNVAQRDGFFKVSCYEGLVRVDYNQQEYRLAAGNSFAVIDGKIRQQTNSVDTVPAWLNNESSFESIPLKYVFEELARQYDIEVIYQEDIDSKALFTGTFSNTNLKIALESISAPSQMSYTLREDKVLFHGKDAH